MKFRSGDLVSPTTLSIQGSDASRVFVGRVGKVIDPKTSTGGVRVEFDFPYRCTTGGVEYPTSKFVYYPAALRLVGVSDGPGLVERVRDARKHLSELEAALEARSLVDEKILEVYRGVTKLTDDLPQPAREEIIKRLGDISTIPV